MRFWREHDLPTWQVLCSRLKRSYALPGECLLLKRWNELSYDMSGRLILLCRRERAHNVSVGLVLPCWSKRSHSMHRGILLSYDWFERNSRMPRRPLLSSRQQHSITMPVWYLCF